MPLFQSYINEDNQLECTRHEKWQVIQEVKFLTRTRRPDMIFLLETMVNEKNTKIILSLMGYDHFDYVLPINHSGGLAVLWNEGNIHASVLVKEQ